ncbi:MAG TPA: hypothetical protein VKV26_18645 [Dehalococcoidia bacterium]|nr:hypothetical protein [Dehalococcoidia bacterium]
MASSTRPQPEERHTPEQAEPQERTPSEPRVIVLRRSAGWQAPPAAEAPADDGTAESS